jgi:protein-disulfide isomerase
MTGKYADRSLAALIVSAIVCAIFFGLVAAAGCASSQPAQMDDAPLTGEPAEAAAEFKDSDIVPVGDSPVLGAESAPVTIVAFSDFQCPYCERGSRTVAQLLKTFPEDVRVVFKHYPLPFHKQADEAAAAAVAAGNQGKFWEMHDWLFANQRLMAQHAAEFEDWAAEYAGLLKMDVERFRKDFNSPKTAAIIARDVALGQKLGVRGTPHFFINGERIAGARAFSTFVDVVKARLAQAESMKAGGAAPGEVYAKAVAANYDGGQPTPRAPSMKDAPAAADEPAPRVDTSKLTVDPDQVKGPKDAKVTVFVFADFQCPFCRRGDANLKEALAQVDEPVRVIYKHFPLPFHKQAVPAAKAAMAAGEQGKFWEMHDLLFASQRELGDEGIYVELAKKLDLDIDQFKEDMKKREFQEQINEDMFQGRSIGVRGTPAIVVDGTMIMGAQPTETFVEAIEEALSQKQ